MSEWTTVDKSEWGDGPWQNEPDKIHWIDPATDLDCLMHRGPSGSWCGYVAVSEGHPAYQTDYDSVDVSVHGSLTYSNFCREGNDESVGVCHVPLAGRPDKVWWLGFDCAHSGDVAPAFRDRYLSASPDLAEYMADDVYRDRAWVENEVRDLARQLKAMG